MRLDEDLALHNAADGGADVGHGALVGLDEDLALVGEWLGGELHFDCVKGLSVSL